MGVLELRKMHQCIHSIGPFKTKTPRRKGEIAIVITLVWSVWTITALDLKNKVTLFPVYM